MRQIQKPLCDRRSYQHAVLDNGLRVLAIQDKEAVFAAACANVQVRHLLLTQQLTATPDHNKSYAVSDSLIALGCRSSCFASICVTVSQGRDPHALA